MQVTVYSLPACVQCTQTKKYLDRAGTPYAEVDLSTSLEDYRAVKYLGYTSAPVVIARHDDGTETHWSGFRPDLLATITEKRSA